MPNPDIIRAWKDEAYRASLSPEQRAALPDSPVGPVDLSDDDLADVGGAEPGTLLCTNALCITVMPCWSFEYWCTRDFC